MTYCVAIAVDAGMVFCSDSRTNAGIDQVSTYSKMYRFGVEGQRQFVILSAGNLATTQATISQIKRDIKERANTSLLTVESISDAAEYLGSISLSQQEKHAKVGNTSFEASFIIGGQIAGSKHRIMLVYPEGNHITSSKDTPYLQIGESKYGKPILDRILTPELNLDTCALCALVSMDSTMRSNLSVGPPIETLVYRTDTLACNEPLRLEEGSEFLRELKRSWDQRLKDAFRQMPPFAWASGWDKSSDEQNGVY
ncbi:MAG: peptidase [Pseudohongiellaceae bacterium]|nr:peptidase [Pseudohongiellaceae bacterium]